MTRHDLLAAATLCLALVLAPLAHAGGPLKVAGTTGFDAGLAGTPLTWRAGTISYSTDQGQLSAILPHDAADAFVADAFARWTGISTASVIATPAGQLAEDVNGSNVIFDPVTYSLTLPADILPAAVNTPLAIVYDADGAVTDALLGPGAGGADMCSSNAVYGGPDHYAAHGHYDHALAVINGNCAHTSADLPWLKYQLVRVLGRVLGLGWADVNENAIYGPARLDDYLGFPVMAAQPPLCLVTGCVPSPDEPRMDDRAQLAALYPAASQTSTARVRGSVLFATAQGTAAQPMQGVNVVARWIDPATGQPSSRYVVSSVSGFLFRGNAGNPVTGFVDAANQRYDTFGSADPALEGYFRLSGLEFPDGAGSARYRLTLERVNPLYTDSLAVGPYAGGQVKPSGSLPALEVTVPRGGDVQHDFIIAGSAVDRWQRASSFDAPLPIPPTGRWTASLSGYGKANYYSFPARAGRTTSIKVTALDEARLPTLNKAQPVLGVWSGAQAADELPQVNAVYFNAAEPGVTQLNAQFLASSDFKLGIADYRGDGRPDFRYSAQVLYADAIRPVRAPAAATAAFLISGLGFSSDSSVTVGSSAASVLAAFPDAMYVSVGPQPDGARDVTLVDPAGGSSIMTAAVTFGALATDQIVLVPAPIPATPVGGEAPVPVRARVLQADGLTAVPGATVNFTVSPAGLHFSECGAVTCTLTTDLQGEISAHLLITAPGTMTVTAALANGAFIRTTVVGTEAALDLALSDQTRYMTIGGTAALPLQARVLANGVASGGRTVSYQITGGAATLAAATAASNAQGYATSTLNISNLSGEVDVKACIAPQKTICRDFSVFALPSSAIALEPVAGAQQMIAAGQNFAPLQFRVIDLASRIQAIAAVPVLLRSTIVRWRRPAAYHPGAPNPQPSEPIVLQSSETLAYSDAAGLVTFTPAPDPAFGAVDVDVMAFAGDAGFADVVLTRLGASGSPAGLSGPAQRLDSRTQFRPRLSSTGPPSR
jgi:hypothetical protein